MMSERSIRWQYDSEFPGSRSIYVYFGKWVFMAGLDWHHLDIGIDWRPVYPGYFYLKIIFVRIGVSNG